MALQAVLFDFSGTIIHDEPIHRQLTHELLLSENLRSVPKSYRQICLGKSDRTCLLDLLKAQGRSVTEEYLQKLLTKKATAYQQKLAELPELPFYPDLRDFMEKLRAANLSLGIVTGALRLEVEAVLQHSGLADYFKVLITAEDILNGKPAPHGYLLAAAHLQVSPQNCLAIEDTFPGIEAARAAQIPVLGIAHTYPLHMLQRRANWAVDCFADIELVRIQQVFAAPPNPMLI